MTTSENKPQPLMDPLLGQILGQMAKDSAWTTNQVLDNQDREINEWKSRFLQLWDRIEKENHTVDSLRIELVLNDYSYHAGIAARDLDTK